MKKLFCLLLCLLMLAAAGCAAPAEKAEAPAVDTYTTATETKYIQDKVLMEKSEIETRMAQMLIGPGDYREMYTLGTCYNNVPLTSAIEFVYDPEKVRFYGTSDLGTEKLEQMKLNDSVSLGWVRMLTPDELKGTKKVLSAAAMTYVAALITSLAQLLRLVMVFGSRRRD